MKCLGPLVVILAVLPSVSVAATTDLATSANALGLRLYGELSSQTDPDDLALSPYSVEMAMSLLASGSTGETRGELNRVLGLPSTDLELDFALQSVRGELGMAAVGLDWSDANALYLQDGLALSPTFLKIAKDTFAARVQNVDFTDPSGAASTINDWIERATNGYIKNLVSDLNPRTRLILANAVYFKAPWSKAFEIDDTGPSLFHTSLHGDEEVPTMQVAADFAYRKAEGYQVLALPYRGRSFQMLILLPNERDGAPALARALTGDILTELRTLAASPRQRVTVKLPRFNVDPKSLDLAGALKALGIRRAFEEGQAQLDGLLAPAQAREPFVVSKVLHQAYVSVNEEGTVAAAATSVHVVTFGIEIEPPSQIHFTVDHPFLFAIQDCKTGVCLFFGSVANPGSD